LAGKSSLYVGVGVKHIEILETCVSESEMTL
jgi:hypothetical protein